MRSQRFRLTSSQMAYLLTKLPRGYTLTQNSMTQRERALEKSTLKADPHKDPMLIDNDSSLQSQGIKPTTKSSKQGIKNFSISLEDELYSKSPNVLSIELRKCYVVYHMLKRHIYFKQLEEAIQKLHQMADDQSKNPIEALEGRVVEGPVGYTSTQFWMEVSALFKRIYIGCQNDSNLISMVVQMENHFNELFKYVINQYRGSILNNLTRVHQLRQLFLRIERQRKEQERSLSPERLKACQDKLLELQEFQIKEVWKIVHSAMDPKPSDYLSFEIDKLPYVYQKRLEKYLMEKMKNKAPRIQTALDSISEAPRSSRNHASSAKNNIGKKDNESVSSPLDSIILSEEN